MRKLARKGRREASGRLSVPVSVLKHAGFLTGNSLFVTQSDSGIKLSRSKTRSIGQLSVDVDGRVKISSTALSSAGLSKRNFDFTSNGTTVAVT